jgi:hypothetical protein
LKKWISILFVSLLFACQFGYYLIYKENQQQVKNMVRLEIINGLPESSCDIIENNPSLVWEDDGSEFYANGNLYDVVKIMELNGKTLIYALHDKKEKQLMEDYEKNAGNGLKTPSGNHSLKFQFPDFCFDDSTPSAVPGPSFHQEYFSMDSKLPSVINDILIPPPRC